MKRYFVVLSLILFSFTLFAQDYGQFQKGAEYCAQNKIHSNNIDLFENSNADIKHSFNALNYKFNLDLYSCFISPYPKSFVLDYREATFNFKVTESTKIAEYYRTHLDVFGNCKIAVVTQKPKDVVVPAIVETHDDGYLSKPFYTKEAAINWVLDSQYTK